MPRALASLVACVLLSATALAQNRRLPVPLPDPAAEAVRVEIRLTTRGRFASVRVEGGMFAAADGRRVAGPANLRTAVLENLLALSSNVEGQPATGAYRLVLSRTAPGARVTWRLNVQPGHRASIEVLNLNDELRPIPVDRFEGVAGSSFTTSVDHLRVGGPLPGAPRRSRLVLGHYYPWYERATWADPQMLDQPLRAYSTEDAADVQRQAEDARRAGLDGLISSWQGREVGGGWNHRRMLLLLQAAEAAGMVASIQIETLAANRAHIEGAPLEIDTAVQWFTDIVDLYGSHPAYLRIDGRPVVFVYAWGFGGDATWRAVFDRVRARGRNPFILADSTSTTALAAGAEGIYTYAGNLFAQDIAAFSRSLAVASRSYHQLGASYGPPRLALATVSPGYDETLLNNRPLDRVVSRQGGALYDAQWKAALESGADWVLVTTWNEWLENTQIEGSQLHGETYVWRTRFYSTLFERAPIP